MRRYGDTTARERIVSYCAPIGALRSRNPIATLTFKLICTCLMPIHTHGMLRTAMSGAERQQHEGVTMRLNRLIGLAFLASTMGSAAAAELQVNSVAITGGRLVITGRTSIPNQVVVLLNTGDKTASLSSRRFSFDLNYFPETCKIQLKAGTENPVEKIVSGCAPRGKDGVDGKNGKDGIDGKDGIPGRDGKDGKDGKDGLAGKDGKTQSTEKTVKTARTARTARMVATASCTAACRVMVWPFSAGRAT